MGPPRTGGSGVGQGVEDGREGFGVIRAADEAVGRRRLLGRTPAQVILRWHVQTGFAVIPGSRNVDHIRDNLAVLDFALTDADMAAIATLGKGIRYYNRTDEQLVQFAAWRPAYEKA